MIEKHHRRIDADCTALYSDCERYRYILRAVWDETVPEIMFVMLNPSTATEVENDPTVARCEKRARMAGFGGLIVANIFAYRSTDPAGLRSVADPIGADNDQLIIENARLASKIVCAWGNHGMLLGRGHAMKQSLLRVINTRLYHLGLNKSGEPKHPLYIGYKQDFVAY